MPIFVAILVDHRLPARLPDESLYSRYEILHPEISQVVFVENIKVVGLVCNGLISLHRQVMEERVSAVVFRLHWCVFKPSALPHRTGVEISLVRPRLTACEMAPAGDRK